MKNKIIKKTLVVLACILGFVAGWFIVVRVVSPLTVVKIVASGSLDKPFICNELRVGCYNVAHGRGGQLGVKNWDGGDKSQKQDRLKQIAQLLEDENLDVVVLNEVDFCSFWSGHINQARFIAEHAGYPYRVEQRNVDVAIPFFSLCFGNVILSKYPIVEATFLDYPNPSKFEELVYGGVKKGVVATLSIPDAGKIQVAAVHLSLKSEAVRWSGVQTILLEHQRSLLPMIAMGDFNSTAKGCPSHSTDRNGYSAIDRLGKSKQFVTQWPDQPVDSKDLTFPSNDPRSVIDWIFVSSDWSIKSKKVIPVNLSDHRPVIAVITKAE